ncbi:MAG: hypothetical protein OXC46_07725 [Thaumarchaeota archaeon]|nr:hypothetical protein [Nitrososphaerota archaeon]
MILVHRKSLERHASEMIVGLNGIIPGGVSARDFSAVSGLDDTASKNVLDELLSLGIGRYDDGQYFFSDGDRLRTAIEMLKCGSQLEHISESLGWKDFEGLVAEILSSKNFAVMKNLILTKPRMEIDVVGIRLGVAILIDCKHWKRYSHSALNMAVKKQVNRTKHYVSKTQGAVAVPVIVTLAQDVVEFIDRVPVVPILQFHSFVDDLYGNLDDIQTIKTAQ